eukprot:133836-Alexandrium_andersonii.AAC.1
MDSILRSSQQPPRHTMRPSCVLPPGRLSLTSSTCPWPPRRPALSRRPLQATAGAALRCGAMVLPRASA